MPTDFTQAWHINNLQAELTWLIRAVNPEVPLGKDALGLIVEEVCAKRELASAVRRAPSPSCHCSTFPPFFEPPDCRKLAGLGDLSSACEAGGTDP
jgi:hypothetical protein